MKIPSLFEDKKALKAINNNAEDEIASLMQGFLDDKFLLGINTLNLIYRWALTKNSSKVIPLMKESGLLIATEQSDFNYIKKLTQNIQKQPTLFPPKTLHSALLSALKKKNHSIFNKILKISTGHYAPNPFFYWLNINDKTIGKTTTHKAPTDEPCWKLISHLKTQDNIAEMRLIAAAQYGISGMACQVLAKLITDEVNISNSALKRAKKAAIQQSPAIVDQINMACRQVFRLRASDGYFPRRKPHTETSLCWIRTQENKLGQVGDLEIIRYFRNEEPLPPLDSTMQRVTNAIVDDSAEDIGLLGAMLYNLSLVQDTLLNLSNEGKIHLSDPITQIWEHSNSKNVLMRPAVSTLLPNAQQSDNHCYWIDKEGGIFKTKNTNQKSAVITLSSNESVTTHAIQNVTNKDNFTQLEIRLIGAIEHQFVDALHKILQEARGKEPFSDAALKRAKEAALQNKIPYFQDIIAILRGKRPASATLNIKSP